MTDPTGTDAQHPALVTATGTSAPADPGADATGTYAQHPALVTRLPSDPSAQSCPADRGAVCDGAR
jgi:hypothetical protein